jgi:hypothetical protein
MFDLTEWIQRWVGDLIKWDNIDMSMGTSSNILSICNCARKVHGEITHNLVIMGLKNIFYECSAFILYQWEAIVNHSRTSLILALSALYNPAFTLLRNSLELLIKGVFYEGLAHRRYRDDWIINLGCGESRLRQEIINMLHSEPDLQRGLEENSSLIFDLMLRMKPYISYYIHYRHIVPQVVHWGFLQPLKREDAIRSLKRLYAELSLNVHEHPSTTDVGRAIIERGEVLFEQKPIAYSLREFLNAWLQIYDLATVIVINVSRSRRSGEEVISILSSTLSNLPEYEKAKLPLTRSLIENLGLNKKRSG